MKVFVIGGTGAIGVHAVNALERAGHELTILARKSEDVHALEKRGFFTTNVSIFDPIALTQSFAGHEAVINLASSIPPMSKFMLSTAWEANTKVRTKGSAAISQAAADAGVRKYLQESVVMVYPDSGANWLDETTPPDRYPMAEPNLAAEESVMRFTDRGNDGIILRFGWFYGPGATHSEQFFQMARQHLCVQMGESDSYVSSIFMSDGGEAVAAALNAPAGIYNIVDDNPLTKREYADALGRAANANWWLRIPGRAAYLLGHRTTSLTRSIRASNKKIKDVTSWTPVYSSANEGWQQLAQIMSQERL